MTVKTVNFKSNTDDEELLTISVLNDENVEVSKLSFYNKNEECDIQKELNSSIRNLPKLLEAVYNSGLKREKIIFSNNTVEVD